MGSPDVVLGLKHAWIIEADQRHVDLLRPAGVLVGERCAALGAEAADDLGG
jgi:hypothetical protein